MHFVCYKYLLTSTQLPCMRQFKLVYIYSLHIGHAKRRLDSSSNASSHQPPCSFNHYTAVRSLSGAKNEDRRKHSGPPNKSKNCKVIQLFGFDKPQLKCLMIFLGKSRESLPNNFSLFNSHGVCIGVI